MSFIKEKEIILGRSISKEIHAISCTRLQSPQPESCHRQIYVLPPTQREERLRERGKKSISSVCGPQLFFKRRDSEQSLLYLYSF